MAGPAVQVTYSRHPPGLPHARDTIRKMADLARKGAHSYFIRNLATRIVAHVPSKQANSELAALYIWVRENIKYRNDPVGLEWVQSPKRTVLERAGDCDDIATLLSALAQTLGRPTQFDIVGPQPGRYKHTYVMAQLPSGAWVTLDPVLEPPGDGKPRADLGKFAHKPNGHSLTFDQTGRQVMGGLSGPTTARDRQLWQTVPYFPQVPPTSGYANPADAGRTPTPDTRYRSAVVPGPRIVGAYPPSGPTPQLGHYAGVAEPYHGQQALGDYGEVVYYDEELGGWLKKLGKAFKKTVKAVKKSVKVVRKVAKVVRKVAKIPGVKQLAMAIPGGAAVIYGAAAVGKAEKVYKKAKGLYSAVKGKKKSRPGKKRARVVRKTRGRASSPSARRSSRIVKRRRGKRPTRRTGRGAIRSMRAQATKRRSRVVRRRKLSRPSGKRSRVVRSKGRTVTRRTSRKPSRAQVRTRKRKARVNEIKRPHPEIARKYPPDARQLWDAKSKQFRIFLPATGMAGVDAMGMCPTGYCPPGMVPVPAGTPGGIPRGQAWSQWHKGEHRPGMMGAWRPTISFALGAVNPATSKAAARAAVDAVAAHIRSRANKRPPGRSVPAVLAFQQTDPKSARADGLNTDGLWGINSQAAAAFYLGVSAASLPPVLPVFKRSPSTWRPPPKPVAVAPPVVVAPKPAPRPVVVAPKPAPRPVVVAPKPVPRILVPKPILVVAKPTPTARPVIRTTAPVRITKRPAEPIVISKPRPVSKPRVLETLKRKVPPRSNVIPITIKTRAPMPSAPAQVLTMPRDWHPPQQMPPEKLAPLPGPVPPIPPVATNTTGATPGGYPQGAVFRDSSGDPRVSGYVEVGQELKNPGINPVGMSPPAATGGAAGGGGDAGYRVEVYEPGEPYNPYYDRPADAATPSKSNGLMWLALGALYLNSRKAKSA